MRAGDAFRSLVVSVEKYGQDDQVDIPVTV
jgi:hypothetical protein